MLESANDAAVTLAEHVAGTRAAFVRRMNQRARELKLRDTHFSNPIGLDEAGQLLVRARPRAARDRAAPPQLRPQDRQPHVGDAQHRLPRAHDPQPQHAARRRTAASTGSRPATPRWPATCSSGAARGDGVTLVSVVLGTPSMAARDNDTLALLKWGAGRYERIHPVTRGAVVGTPEIEFRRGATLSLVTAGGVAAHRPQRRRDHRQGRRHPGHRDGPDQARPALRLPRGARRRQADRRGAGRRRPRRCPRPTCRSARRSGSRSRSRCCSPAPLLGATVLAARRARRGPPRPRSPRPQEPEAA